MGIEKQRRLCVEENRMVLAERETPNHVLHLLMSVVTLGLWLFVWLALSIVPNPYRCPSCGGRTRRRWFWQRIPRPHP